MSLSFRCFFSSSASIIAKAFPSSSSHYCCASSCSSVAWRTNMWRAGIRAVLPHIRPLGGLGSVRCYAARRCAKKVKRESEAMEEDAFYVVRKGDVIGVYKSLSDCQAQVSSSICGPPVSVYKGYSLEKETAEYLASQGLKDALYCINAKDCREDLFGTLVPCLFQQPDMHASPIEQACEEASPQKRFKDVGEFNNTQESSGSQLASTEEFKKSTKQAKSSVAQAAVLNHLTCIIEFDGASKGNPGKAGAGVIVRKEDGTIISRLREGLGVVTNNVAEYRALLLGMKYALRNGFQKVLVQGDSNLVCMQVQDLWKTKHQNLTELCKEAKQLKDKFLSFQICHVKREFNSDADAQANLAVTLPSGEVYEELEVA